MDLHRLLLPVNLVCLAASNLIIGLRSLLAPPTCFSQSSASRGTSDFSDNGNSSKCACASGSNGLTATCIAQSICTIAEAVPAYIRQQLYIDAVMIRIAVCYCNAQCHHKRSCQWSLTPQSCGPWYKLSRYYALYNAAQV